MIVGNLVVRIGSNLSGFQKGLQSVVRSVDATAAKMRAAGTRMTLGLSVPIIGAGAAAVKAASDVEELQSKSSAVFKELTGDVRAWAAEHAKSIGRSRFALEGYAADVQDTFVPLGFARDEAAKMSMAVVELSEDLASFKNLRTEDVVQGLTSALVGNVENLRQFGVVANEAQIKAKALKDGIIKSTKEALTPQQKALAIWKLTLEGTTDAQGDALKTAGSFANQMKSLAAVFNEFAVEIGQMLLPAAKQLVAWAKEAINWFRNLAPEVKAAVIAFSGLVAILGPAAVALGVILSSTGLLVVAIGALGAGAILLAQNWEKAKTFFGRAWKSMVLIAKEGTRDILRVIFETSSIDLWSNMIDGFAGAWKVIKSITNASTDAVIDGIVSSFKGLQSELTQAGSDKGSSWWEAALGLEGLDQEIAIAKTQGIATLDDLKRGFRDFAKGISSGGFRKQFEAVIDDVVDGFGWFQDQIKGIVAGLAANSKKAAVEVNKAISGINIASGLSGTSARAIDLSNLVVTGEIPDIAQEMDLEGLGVKVDGVNTKFVKTSSLLQTFRDWSVEARKEFDEMLTSGGSNIDIMRDKFDKMRELVAIGFEGLASSISSFFNRLVTGVTDGVSAFQTLTAGILNTVAAVVGAIRAQILSMTAMSATIKFITGDIAGGLRDIGRGVATLALLSAAEGVLQGLASKVTETNRAQVELPRLASGGIVRRPTVAMIGEAGPEAIVPLKNGGGLLGQLAVTGQLRVGTAGDLYVELDRFGRVNNMKPIGSS